MSMAPLHVNMRRPFTPELSAQLPKACCGATQSCPATQNMSSEYGHIVHCIHSYTCMSRPSVDESLIVPVAFLPCKHKLGRYPGEDGSQILWSCMNAFLCLCGNMMRIAALYSRVHNGIHPQEHAIMQALAHSHTGSRIQHQSVHSRQVW